MTQATCFVLVIPKGDGMLVKMIREDLWPFPQEISIIPVGCSRASYRGVMAAAGWESMAYTSGVSAFSSLDK